MLRNDKRGTKAKRDFSPILKRKGDGYMVK